MTLTQTLYRKMLLEYVPESSRKASTRVLLSLRQDVSGPKVEAIADDALSSQGPSMFKGQRCTQCLAYDVEQSLLP